MNINDIIEQFISFLNNSYERIQELSMRIENDNNNIVLADKIENGFYQFIWEIIVEAQLCLKEEYLEPYGDGADFYGTSSRVTYPDKISTKRIIINVTYKMDHFSIRKINAQKLEIIKFVSYNGREYSVSKPFDFVLCGDNFGNQFLFKFNEVDYSIVNIDESI